MSAKLIAFALLLCRTECILTERGNDSDTDRKEASRKFGDDVSQYGTGKEFPYGEDHSGGYGAAHSTIYGDGYEHLAGSFEPERYYGYEEHYKHEHKERDPAYYKALAIKSLLIPLAGVALLGAAAALVSNPILLQLGVVSGTYGRRKRDLMDNLENSRNQALEKYREIQLLKRFVAQAPSERGRYPERKLLGDYLSCAGVADSCLERLACELHSAEAASMPEEKRVMAIVTNQILGSGFASEDVKARTAEAAKLGKAGRDCRAYECGQLAGLVERGQ